MEEKKEKVRKKYIWLECTECGHRWRSYGVGKIAKCPKCYEARTGKKYGQSPEKMAELRARRQKKKVAAVSEDTVTVTDTEQPKNEPPTPEQQPQPKPTEKSFFREFLGF